MAATTPPFDFNDFARQLQAAVSTAITKGFKDLDFTDLGDKIQKSVKKIDRQRLLDLDEDLTSLKAMQDEIQKLREIRAAGGQEALAQTNQESRLAQELIRSKVDELKKQDDYIAASREDQKKMRDALFYAGLNEVKTTVEQLRLESLKNQTQKEYLAGVDLLKGKLDRVKAIMSDPKLSKTILATEGIKLLIGGMQNLRAEFDKFRQQGQTITQSLGGTIDSITLKSVLFGFKTGDALRAAQSELGDLDAASGEAADNMATLAAVTGASAETAGKLQAQLQQIPGQTAESSTNTAKFAANLARSANVAPGKVIEAMANNTEEIAKFSANGGQNFARAAVGAAKMGVEVNKIAAAAEALLDFENSINKQMEASVLLGREINFDKARELALQGDLVGATQSMLTQLGGEAEFNRMNLIQKKALAESMGMSVADLGKLVKNQDKFNEAQKEALANGQSLDEVLAMGGGFLDQWGGPIKDFAVGVLQSIPTLLVYRQLRLQTAGAIATETTAENAGIVAKIRKTAATVANTIATTANSVARGAWNIVTGIGTTLMNSSIVMWLREAAGKAANTASTVANTVARWLGIGAKVTEATTNATLSASNVVLGTTSTAGATGLTAMAGAAAVAVIPLIGLGVAILLMTPALKVLGDVVIAVGTVIGNVLMKALEMLPAIVQAVSDGFVRMFDAMAKNWQILIPVGIGLMAVAGGIIALGAASFAVGPAMLALTGIGIALLPLSFSLGKIAESASGLSLVGDALVKMGVGLGTIADRGLGAIPVLGALTGLAIVAPLLSGLGSILGGGGGGGEEEDKMDVMVQKLDQLISVVSTPAAVMMDGKKVGDAIRLNVGTTVIR